jgi:UDP-N-acetylmuramate--alanine ligase
VSAVESWEDAVDLILPEMRPQDVVLTLGAGDIWKAGDLLAARLAASPAVTQASVGRET